MCDGSEEPITSTLVYPWEYIPPKAQLFISFATGPAVSNNVHPGIQTCVRFAQQTAVLKIFRML